MSQNDPTDIRSQEDAHAEVEAKKRLSRDTEEGDFKWLMGSKRGRRIVWRLLERAKVFHPSWNTNSMTMAFNEGTKNEGYYTLALINSLCPELYHLMIKEANDNRNPDDTGSHNDH